MAALADVGLATTNVVDHNALVLTAVKDGLIDATFTAMSGLSVARSDKTMTEAAYNVSQN